MKSLQSMCGTWEVAEDEEYNLHLVRGRGGDDMTIVHLYEVTVMCVNLKRLMVAYCDKVYVLADTEAAAESQASCIMAKKHQLACKEYEQHFCKAMQVPLGLRGWSGYIF